MQEIRRKNHTIVGSVQRPNDTNAYTAGDVIADSTSAPSVITLKNATSDFNGSGVIDSAVCVSSFNNTTKPDLELWLFNAAPAATNDNAAFAPTDAEMLNLVGVIPFPVASFKVGNAASATSGNAACVTTNCGVVINSKAGVSDLYAVPVVRNAYTPGGLETITFTLSVLD